MTNKEISRLRGTAPVVIIRGTQLLCGYQWLRPWRGSRSYVSFISPVIPRVLASAVPRKLCRFTLIKISGCAARLLDCKRVLSSYCSLTYWSGSIAARFRMGEQILFSSPPPPAQDHDVCTFVPGHFLSRRRKHHL